MLVSAGPERGAVLMEVVLALILFVGAAAVISGGIHSSLNTVDRMRLNAHATDLAISVLSELQLGIRSLEQTGPEAFEMPFTNWTWEVVSSPVEVSVEAEANPLTKVEVIVRHDDPVVTFRLFQMLRPGTARPPREDTEASLLETEVPSVE